MGICAWIKSKVDKAIDKVYEGVTWAKEKGRELASKAKETTTNLWNKFSGKSDFDEAEELYQKISNKYNERRRRFDEELEQYTDSIQKRVEHINQAKETIKTDLFVRMANNMEKLHDISVSEDFTVEAYKAAALSFDSVRSREQLYTIDFNKHKFKTSIHAIFTLGFYTRKKAKETLYAVQEEVNTEIAKMDAEVKKLQVIDQSLENVEYYFDSLIALYERLLIRLDNNVNYLYVRCLSFAHKLVHKEMSVRRLPRMQQKEVEAIVTASKILKVMTDAQILAIEDSDAVKVYGKDMKEQFEAMNEAVKAA